MSNREEEHVLVRVFEDTKVLRKNLKETLAEVYIGFGTNWAGF